MSTKGKEKKDVKYIKRNKNYSNKQIRPEQVKKPEAVSRPEVAQKTKQVPKPEAVLKTEVAPRPESVSKPETTSNSEQTQKPEAIQALEQIQKPESIPKSEAISKSESGEKSLPIPGQQNTDNNSEKVQSESSLEPAADVKVQEIEAADSPKKEESTDEKKNRRPTTIYLTGKSELFKKIIDIALACEAQISEKKKLKEKNDLLMETCERLTEEKKSLDQQLKESEISYKAKLDEISELQTDVARRDEAIGIIKADKTESAQEYKNALAASLRPFYTDFVELKEMGTSDDVGLAVIEVFDGVLKVLEKNGIVIEK